MLCFFIFEENFVIHFAVVGATGTVRFFHEHCSQARKIVAQFQIRKRNHANIKLKLQNFDPGYIRHA